MPTARRARRGAHTLKAAVCLLLACVASTGQVLNDPVDVGQEFQRMEQVYFVGSKVAGFDAGSGRGTLQWDRYARSTTLSFNKIDVGLGRAKATEFPGTEYDADPALPFRIDFVSPRAVRLRLCTRDATQTDKPDEPSLMLAAAPPRDDSWKVEQTADAVTYTSARGRVRLVKDGRRVYLAPGAWIYYRTGELHAGERWRRIKTGPITVVLLVGDAQPQRLGRRLRLAGRPAPGPRQQACRALPRTLNSEGLFR